jgi:hypothetical protein
MRACAIECQTVGELRARLLPPRPPNRVRRGRSRPLPRDRPPPYDRGKDARREFMIRFILGLLALAASAGTPQGRVWATEPRSFPMHFEWKQEGPVENCGRTCRNWISAVGAITSGTPAEFAAFVEGRDVRGATVVFDSEGGSTLGAMGLGDMIRNLNMTTAVGRTIELPGEDGRVSRTTVSPHADCESMCAFVLLAGVRRYVPPEGRVRVHGIWLGDRRDDARAASYSAEDLAILQHDVGLLAQYTVRMGVSIDLLETAARVPPWEPLRLLSQEELRGMQITNSDYLFDGSPVSVVANSLASSSY